MTAPSPHEITGLLRRWSAGDVHARDQLIPLLYDRLRELAHHRLRERPAETSLNTTGLVHETYLRLLGASHLDFADRARFLALMSQVMRNVLAMRARARRAIKRGGTRTPVEFNEAFCATDEELDRFAILDEALMRLQTVSERQAELLQHRYFGGLSLEESAAAVGVSLATAKRELRSARAWLALELADDG